MKRFARLEDVYNTLVAASFDFNTLPVNNKYRKYKEWKTNPEQRKLPESSQQLQGAKKTVGIDAFGFVSTSGANKTSVKMSGRSFLQISGMGGVTLYGVVEAPADYPKRSGFSPAKAHLATKKASGVAVPGTSNRITGQAYRSYTDESYVVPFGKVADTDTEFSRQDAILANRAATHVVTFTPERLRRGQ